MRSALRPAFPALSALAVSALALGAAGCVGEGGAGEGVSPPGQSCESPVRLAAGIGGLTAPDRYLLGEAALFPHNPEIREREGELASSIAARRALGWRLAGELLRPIEITVGAGEGEVRALPRFMSFYDREDLRRIHRHLPEGFAEATAAGQEEALDAAFAWNAEAVLEQEAWPADRLADYIASLDTEERARGVGGISRTLYGPRAARHLLRSERALLACRGNTIGPLEASGTREAPVRERREVAELAACEVRRFGPYFVAEGGALRASLEEASGFLGAPSLRLLGVEEGGRPGQGRCEGARCEALGPARVELEVAAPALDRSPAEVALALRWDDSEALFVPCLEGGFESGSVIVKADYRRVGFGFELPVHDTSAAGLRAVREGGADWGEGTGSADPGPEEIFTIELPGGERYRLVALHAMLKELDHWVWVSLFWSGAPELDFGADRPAGDPAFAPGGPFARYKMCISSAFLEGDPELDGGAEEASLGAALAEVHEGAGGPSWCSNPYLEEGAGNASTNCVGCHQHAGGPLTSEEILSGEGPLFRRQGRELVRTNFPTDYSFSAMDLAAIFLEP